MKALFKRLFKSQTQTSNTSNLSKFANISLGESDNRWENRKVYVDDVMIPEDIYSSLQQKGKKVDQTFINASDYDKNK